MNEASPTKIAMIIFTSARVNVPSIPRKPTSEGKCCESILGGKIG